MHATLFDDIEVKKKEFRQAKPFPSIVIDNFLPLSLAERLLENFPKSEEMSREYKALNEYKSEESDIDSLDKSFSELKSYLSDKKFLKFLTELAGIDNLLPDEHNFGGGCHQGKKGSYLDIHADFNIHPISSMHRRLNLLIYFNKEWSADKGGYLELWDKEMKQCENRIAPSFNKCVIFETSDTSFHGYAEVNCQDNETRKSFAAYYYTKDAPFSDKKIKEHTTIFKTRPTEPKAKSIKTSIRNYLATIYTRVKNKKK